MKHLFTTLLVIFGLALGCSQKRTGAENAATLDDLNRALVVVTMRSGSFPPSTNDLAAFLAMSGKTMPAPPPGKRLAIDAGTRQFVLVDQ
jgi:hypothetical protein